MADILPFRGLIYNPEKIQDLSWVAAPPYDVISAKARPGYYAKHPNNVIRLELGDESALAEKGPDRYRPVAKYLEEWEDQKILIREKEPAFYFYRVEFPAGKKIRKVRKGFLGLCRLEEFGKGMVFPHERIHEEQKEDRIMILKSCQANISPIFSLYSDPQQTIDRLFQKAVTQPPLFDFIGEEDTHHQLWSVKDQTLLRAVCESMKARKLFIADGHHRYQAALAYKKELERSGDLAAKEGFNYVMMYFCAFEDEGLTILPSHRLLFDIPGFDRNRFESRLSEYFLLKHFPFDASNEPEKRIEFLNALEKERKNSSAFGLFMRGNDYYTLLVFKQNKAFPSIVASTVPVVLQKLDVVILHRLILEHLLEMKEEDQNLSRIQIIKNASRGLDRVREGGFQMIFLMNPPKNEEVQEVALQGEFMPQKSTFFFPKVPTGLVINRILSGKMSDLSTL